MGGFAIITLKFVCRPYWLRHTDFDLKIALDEPSNGLIDNVLDDSGAHIKEPGANVSFLALTTFGAANSSPIHAINSTVNVELNGTRGLAGDNDKYKCVGGISGSGGKFGLISGGSNPGPSIWIGP